MRLAVLITLLATLMAFLVISFLSTLCRTVLDENGEIYIMSPFTPVPTPTPYIQGHEAAWKAYEEMIAFKRRRLMNPKGIGKRSVTPLPSMPCQAKPHHA